LTDHPGFVSLAFSHRKYPMKISLQLAALTITTCFSIASLLAGDTAQEKAFIDKYKTAFEAKDTVTLESFLYTKEASPMAIEFYKMMQSNGAGGKISKIELVDLTPDDVKKAAEIMDGPGGDKMRLPLKPTKKLKITVETIDGDSSSTSTSETFIAEKDGKLVIPVPGPLK
jgi:hypothetical protein